MLAAEASASKRAARSPASPERASFAPRGRPSAQSSREGLVQAASNLGRLRSESFQSDDGEDAADDAEHAPRGPQDKAQSALSLLTVAASTAVSGPPVSPRSQPPVDLAVLLAPELGVQVRPSGGERCPCTLAWMREFLRRFLLAEAPLRACHRRASAGLRPQAPQCSRVPALRRCKFGGSNMLPSATGSEGPRRRTRPARRAF